MTDKELRARHRDAQIQVLKGLRDLKAYIEVLEDELNSDRNGLWSIPYLQDISEESVNLGKASLDHSIKGLTNEINK